jgi:prefoldin subunit 5
MKRLNEEADALKKAAEGAAEQLKKLEETKKTLDTLETKMSNLVKGTKEWTEALIENNN